MVKMLKQIIAVSFFAGLGAVANAATVSNPLIWADVPDMSIMRDGENYYMVSTTMHYNPGVPIMKSTDLANWRIVNYAYDVLADNDKMNLANGQNAYGNGSWASSVRKHGDTYYILTPSYTTGKTHLYTTDDIENGDWNETLLPFYHDPSLFFDDDGSVFVFYGTGTIRYVELNADAKSVKAGGRSGVMNLPIEATVGKTGLAEGSHMHKVNGYYYLFMITWPSNNCRTEVVFRSKTLTGNYEGKKFLQNNGVAQGSIFDTPDGKWYSYLFRDNGGVGRIPYLMEVEWKDNWPEVKGGAAPATLELENPVNDGYNMVTSDDFDGDVFPLEWQWNHNPDNKNWSRKDGKLRITTGRVDSKLITAKNTLTQRSYGPKCSGRTLVNGKGMKDGDLAGLVALADSLGFVALEKTSGGYNVVYYEREFRIKSEAYNSDEIQLRIDFDFSKTNWGFTDRAKFYYSADGKNWKQIGNELKLPYTLGMFVGYRFGLFNFATKTAGGYAEFDWYKVGDDVNDEIYLDEIAGSESVPQTPYESAAGGNAGVAAKIPGKIEAEYFDNGGQKNAYYDADKVNQGDANFRTDERVDIVLMDAAGVISADSKGMAVGYTSAGEWLEYTVNVTAAGKYSLYANVASGSETSALQFFVDDKAVTEEFTVPKTGDNWSVYKKVKVGEVELSAGEHIVRMDIAGSFVNIDWFEFVEPGKESEAGENDSTTNFLADRYAAPVNINAQSIQYYDMQGHRLNKNAALHTGAYIMRLPNGKTLVKRVEKNR